MTTRALLTEDEPEGLENLKNLLRMCCPEVDVVAEGGSNADLLRLADDRDNRFDVAFLDISLPDGLVFQALQQLEEVPFKPLRATTTPARSSRRRWSRAQATQAPQQAPSDDLLDQLDAIVIGSKWGQAPILTRSQAHDRALAREFDYQAQEEEARYKP